MLVLGLVLIAFAVLAVCAGLFGAGDVGDASLIGIHLGATAVFLVGFVAGVALLFGFSLTKWGGKRQFRQARERRRLEGIAQKVEQTEHAHDQERE
ncbi:hypothetical protein [Nocardioides sp. KR10-350]|uniref:hypothetical protein n=1 Tax=Nocardioides cheoyonin TaxID=3156615 RepID=UPI0032B53A00